LDDASEQWSFAAGESSGNSVPRQARDGLRWQSSKMFEHRSKPLVPGRVFALRVLRSLALALGIIGVSLGLGVFGYHFCAGLSWLDALLNAAMILTGMGPVNELHSVAGKLFASFYALFSGVVFITSVAVLLAPVFHRFLHKFHLEAGIRDDDRRERPREAGKKSGGAD
jgi:hypothetical protein